MLKSCLTTVQLSAATLAIAQNKGVTDTEIVLGLITDLSGPIANYGKESRNGMNMAVDEINAKGGVQGRKIRVVIEDHGYEPKRALLAAQKLVQQDKVFAILGHLGTATNMAALPFVLENNVFNFMPQGASPALSDPPSPYKIALAPPYFTMTTSRIHRLGWRGAQDWLQPRLSRHGRRLFTAGAPAGRCCHGRRLRLDLHPAALCR